MAWEPACPNRVLFRCDLILQKCMGCAGFCCPLDSSPATHAPTPPPPQITRQVPTSHEPLLRRAMLDHDRDMAAFYNHLADLLEA